MIILVRHPPTKLNEQGKVRGQLDPPVPPEGRAVAKNTAAQFRKVKVDRIYTDDTKRTRCMADEIAKVTGAPVTFTDGLRTWNLGDFAGQKIEDVSKDIVRYMSKDVSKAVPGGESFEIFAKRFIRFFIPFYSSPKTIVMVTHGRPIMTAKAWQDADGASAPVDLAGKDLSPEPKLVVPGGIALIGDDRPFEVVAGVGDAKDKK